MPTGNAPDGGGEAGPPVDSRTELSEAGAVKGAEFERTVKDRKKEIGRDLFAKMCADLNIDPHDL